MLRLRHPSLLKPLVGLGILDEFEVARLKFLGFADLTVRYLIPAECRIVKGLILAGQL